MNFQQQFGQSNPLRNPDDKRTDAELFTGIPFVPILSINESNSNNNNSSRNGNGNILPFTKNQIIESQNKSSEFKKKFENIKQNQQKQQQAPPPLQPPLKSSTSNVLPQFEDDDNNGGGSQDFNIDFSLDLEPMPLQQIQQPSSLLVQPKQTTPTVIPSFDKLIGSPSQSFQDFYYHLFNRCQEKMRSKDIWNDSVKQLDHFTFESLMKHVIGLSVFLLDPESYNKVNNTTTLQGEISYDGKSLIKENMNLFTEQRNESINKISEFLEKKQYAFKRLVDESIYFFQYIDIGILPQTQEPSLSSSSSSCKCIFTEETLVPGVDKVYVICVHTLEKEIPQVVAVEESDEDEEDDNNSDDEDSNNSDTDDNNNNNEDKEATMKRSLVKPNLPSTPSTAIVHSVTAPPSIRHYYIKHYNQDNNDKLYLKLLISLLQYQTFEMDIMNAINIWKRKKKEQQKRTDFINSNTGNAIKMNVLSTATATTTTENLFHTFLYDEIFEKIIQNQIILDHIVWNWMKSLMM